MLVYSVISFAQNLCLVLNICHCLIIINWISMVRGSVFPRRIAERKGWGMLSLKLDLGDEMSRFMHTKDQDKIPTGVARCIPRFTLQLNQSVFTISLFCNATHETGPYAHCGQRRRWPACTLSQADLGLCYPLTESMDTVVYADKQRIFRSELRMRMLISSLFAYGIRASPPPCASMVKLLRLPYLKIRDVFR